MNITFSNLISGKSSIGVADLRDTNIVDPINGQVLTYNGTTLEWINSTITYPVTSVNGKTGAVVLAATDIGGYGSFVDNAFQIVDDVDPTKIAMFQLSSIPTATTRTYTLPNVTGALATIGSLTQTFSGTTTFSGATVTVGTSTATSTYGLGTGATLSGSTRTVNIGINGVAGSTTNINIGSVLGTGTVTFNQPISAGTITATTITGALTGNASTATTLQTSRTFSASGDATAVVQSFDGSANVVLPMLLATVNSTPSSNALVKITSNGKGLVTGTTAVVAADITSLVNSTYVLKAGDTMTGPLLLNADPTQALGAVTKQYVDNVAAGLNVKASTFTATTATLATSSAGTITYANGTAGVGATLTTTGSFATIGGATTANGNRILVKNEATAVNNGIYVRTSATVLTRAADFDNSPVGEIASGDFTFISTGTLAGTNWALTTPDPITVGTTGLVFTQLSGAGQYTASTGIAINSNAISNTGVLSVTTNTGLSANVSAVGNVTITNTGVTGITGTANQITASASTGAITLSLPSAVTISGAMTAGSFVGNASTATDVAGGAAGQLHYQTAANDTAFLAAGTTSQVLIGGAAAPAWTNTPTLTGTNITGIPNAGLTNSTITIGTTSIALGASSTTLTGLTSVTSTGFTGALTGSSSLNVLKAGDTMTGTLNLPVNGLVAGTNQLVLANGAVGVGLVPAVGFGSGALITSGSLQVGYGTSTAAGIEIGQNRTVDGASYIDFHSLVGATDYEARLVRNTGADGSLVLSNTGTGVMSLLQAGLSPIVFYTNGLERMRINQTASVSIGTTTGFATLTLKGPAGTFATAYSQNELQILDPSGTDGVNTGFYIQQTYPASNTAGIFTLGTGASNNHQYALALATQNAERMRIGNTGNIVMGSTTVDSSTTLKVVGFGGNNSTITADGGSTATVHADIGIVRSGTESFALGQGASLAFSNTTSSSSALIQQASSNLQFFTLTGSTWTERMRLTPTGGVLLGTSTSANWPSIVFDAASSGATGRPGIAFKRGGTQIWAAGMKTDLPTEDFYMIANPAETVGVYMTKAASGWVNMSDERGKENIVEIESAVDKVATLRAATYNIKADPTLPRDVGLIAQDLIQVLPEAVDATNPEKLGIRYTAVIPLLVAAIKEMKIQNEILTARVAALETK